MNKVFFIKKENIFKLSLFISFSALAIFVPVLKNKILIGTIVNAILFLSTFYLGITPSLIIGSIPSLVAIAIEVLPVFLMPVIPLIILANTILISFFAKMKKDLLISMFIAAFLKCSFLYLAGWFLSSYFVQLRSLFILVSAHQAITAFLGMSLAFILIKTNMIGNKKA